MRLFISWSQSPSRAYAKIFRDWIDGVFQNLRPFMSDVDIDAGEPWLNAIQSQLNESDFGVAFVTPVNINSQWMHYEAGAIGKAVGKSRLIPILCGVDFVDLNSSPLKFLQAKNFDREGIKSVCSLINKALGDNGISPDIFEKTFETWWPHLEAQASNLDVLEMPDKGIEDPIRSAIDGLSERVGVLARQTEQIMMVVVSDLYNPAKNLLRRDKYSLPIINYRNLYENVEDQARPGLMASALDLIRELEKREKKKAEVVIERGDDQESNADNDGDDNES